MRLAAASRLATEGVDVKTDDHVSACRIPPLIIPKFEDKHLDDAAKYIDMFENVMLQNGYEERRWAIALRTAVFESKLQDAVEVGGSYGEIKEEILATFGQTPENLWRGLVTLAQGDESFRQLCLRTKRRLQQFLELAQNDNDMIDTIVKFLVLENASRLEDVSH